MPGDPFVILFLVAASACAAGLAGVLVILIWSVFPSVIASTFHSRRSRSEQVTLLFVLTAMVPIVTVGISLLAALLHLLAAKLREYDRRSPACRDDPDQRRAEITRHLPPPAC